MQVKTGIKCQHKKSKKHCNHVLPAEITGKHNCCQYSRGLAHDERWSGIADILTSIRTHLHTRCTVTHSMSHLTERKMRHLNRLLLIDVTS